MNRKQRRAKSKPKHNRLHKTVYTALLFSLPVVLPTVPALGAEAVSQKWTLEDATNTKEEKAAVDFSEAEHRQMILDLALRMARGDFGAGQTRFRNMAEAGYATPDVDEAQVCVDTIYRNRLYPCIYILYIDSATGTVYGDEFVKRGSVYSSLAPSDTETMTFAGWFLDKACQTPVSPDTPIEQSTVLYAGWTPLSQEAGTEEGTSSKWETIPTSSNELEEPDVFILGEPETVVENTDDKPESEHAAEEQEVSEIISKDEYLETVCRVARGLYGIGGDRPTQLAAAGFTAEEIDEIQTLVDEIYRDRKMYCLHLVYADPSADKVIGWELLKLGTVPGNIPDGQELYGDRFLGWYADEACTVPADTTEPVQSSQIWYALLSPDGEDEILEEESHESSEEAAAEETSDIINLAEPETETESIQEKLTTEKPAEELAVLDTTETKEETVKTEDETIEAEDERLQDSLADTDIEEESTESANSETETDETESAIDGDDVEENADIELDSTGEEPEIPAVDVEETNEAATEEVIDSTDPAPEETSDILEAVDDIVNNDTTDAAEEEKLPAEPDVETAADVEYTETSGEDQSTADEDAVAMSLNTTEEEADVPEEPEETDVTNPASAIETSLEAPSEEPALTANDNNTQPLAIEDKEDAVSEIPDNAEEETSVETLLADATAILEEAVADALPHETDDLDDYISNRVSAVFREILGDILKHRQESSVSTDVQSENTDETSLFDEFSEQVSERTHTVVDQLNTFFALSKEHAGETEQITEEKDAAEALSEEIAVTEEAGINTDDASPVLEEETVAATAEAGADVSMAETSDAELPAVNEEAADITINESEPESETAEEVNTEIASEELEETVSSETAIETQTKYLDNVLKVARGVYGSWGERYAALSAQGYTDAEIDEIQSLVDGVYRDKKMYCLYVIYADAKTDMVLGWELLKSGTVPINIPDMDTMYGDSFQGWYLDTEYQQLVETTAEVRNVQIWYADIQKEQENVENDTDSVEQTEEETSVDDNNEAETDAQDLSEDTSSGEEQTTEEEETKPSLDDLPLEYTLTFGDSDDDIPMAMYDGTSDTVFSLASRTSNALLYKNTVVLNAGFSEAVSAVQEGSVISLTTDQGTELFYQCIAAEDGDQDFTLDYEGQNFDENDRQLFIYIPVGEDVLHGSEWELFVPDASAEVEKEAANEQQKS